MSVEFIVGFLVQRFFLLLGLNGAFYHIMELFHPFISSMSCFPDSISFRFRLCLL